MTYDTRDDLEARIGAVLAAAGVDAAMAKAIIEGRGGLPGERTLALVALDPIGIQRQVLASRRFVTRLGASDALRHWDEQLREARGERACLYAGGGQAVLLAPAEAAEALVSDLQREFKGRHLGHLGAAFRICSPSELSRGPNGGSIPPEALRAIERLGLLPEGGGFGALLRQTQERLRANKDATHATSALGGRVCTECGTRAGEHKLGDELLCRPCHRMRDQSKDSEHRSAAESFDELGEGRKLAFLSIDGTGVGAALGRQGTLRQYVDFSRRLDAAFDWAEVLKDLSWAGVERVIPVVRGGDDLGLVFGADQGRGAFRAALSVVEGLIKRLSPIGVGVGAGLVVTRTLSARKAMELAGQLVKSAKRRGRLSGQSPIGAIDFERVDGGTVLSDTLEGLREERRGKIEPAFGWNDLPQYRIAGARPHLLDEAVRLADVVEEIEGEDWGTLYRLAEQLSNDFVSGALYATYTMRKRRDLAAQLSASDSGPWARDNGYLWGPDPDPERKDTVRLHVHDVLDVHRILREVSR